MRGLMLCFSAAILATIAGCGPSNGLDLAKVRGKVTYNGQPIEYGTIMFEPDESRGTTGPPASGSITSGGSFILSTDESGDGAIVGSHRVAVMGLEPMPQAQQLTLPNPETSPREYMTAKDQVFNRAERQRKSDTPTYTDKSGKVFRITVPSKITNPNTSDIKIKVDRGSNTVTIAIGEDGTAEIGH